MHSAPAPTLRPRDVARRVLVASTVLVLLVVGALALWAVRLLVLLFLLSVVIAAAMRPGVEALRRRGVPTAAGIALHYVVLAALVGLLLWFAVPRAVGEAQHAVASLPETRSTIESEAAHSTGLKHDFLVGLEHRLAALPSRDKLLEPGVEVTRHGVEILVGIFFVFAGAAYWMSERDRVVRLGVGFLPARKRETARQTWDLIERKLGAFVRGQLLLMTLVAAALALAFRAIGLPYWLLVGVFGGIVELVPVVGPLAAGALAVGVGLTESVHTAVLAGLVVLAVRLLEDYVVMPRVLGDAVGLSPLLVLVAVSACGVLLGGLAVLVAIPIAVVLATLVDVLVLRKDPAAEDVPTVIFPAKDTET